MHENKYYTPHIEDIRIGYECEINKTLIPGMSDGQGKYKIEHLKKQNLFIDMD